MPDLKTTLLLTAVLLWVGVQYGLVVWALRDLKRRRSVRGGNKVLWGLLILCLPVAGALIYGAVAPTTPLAASPRPMAPRLRLLTRDDPAA
ncbi:MAG: PLD nuclease N-terminal domain-containing protein [Thermomicrobiales bacterium]